MSCLVDSFDQFQHQLQQQKSSPYYHNHQRRFSNNSAITVIAGPRASVANAFSVVSNGSCSNISPAPSAVAVGSQLSLLQPPSAFSQYQQQQKQIAQQLMSPIKKCLLSSERNTLIELLNVFNETLKINSGTNVTIEDHVDNLVQKLINGNATIYSSPPPSATTPHMLTSLFSTSTTTGFAPTQLSVISPLPVESTLPELIQPIINDFDNSGFQQQNDEKTVTSATKSTQQSSTAVKAQTVKKITIPKLSSPEDLQKRFISSETMTKTATKENLPLESTLYQTITELPDSENNFSNNALELTVRRIIDTTRIWISNHSRNGMSAECAVKLCEFVARESGAGFIELANLQHRSDENLEGNRENFLSQLTPMLDELVEPMIGMASASSNAIALVDAFLNALSNTLRNDLTFWTLLRTADALISQAENN